MASTDIEPSEITKWDPGLTERVMGFIRPLIKGYHRAEVRGLETSRPAARWWCPTTPAACSPMDVPVFADRLLREVRLRPAGLHAEPRHASSPGRPGDFFSKTGFIRANHENADEALRSGGVVVVFPGGDYDVYRPTLSENKIDFGGRTGYVRAALNAGVPIVPTVGDRRPGERRSSCPAATWLAKRLVRSHKLVRAKILPISFGFPFGLSAVLPVNVPLPTKIVMQVLPPIDIVAEFGEDPDIDEVDAHVRHVMQRALDELAEERRLPVLG